METALTVAPAMITSGIPAPVSQETLFDRFIDYTDVQDITLKGYATGIRNFAEWMKQNGITQPTREDVKAYKKYLETANYKAGTQAAYFRTVKHFFHWLFCEGLYPNVADNLKGAKTSADNMKRDAFKREDFQAVLESISTDTVTGIRDYLLIALCAQCALRIIELHRANIGDFKMMRGECWLYVQGKGHNEKDTPVKVDLELYDLIMEYIATRPGAKKNDPLFVGTSNRAKGQRLSEPSISTIIKERFKAAGYDSDKLTAHSLRHTGVTALLRANGGNIQQAQHFARHKSMNTTLIYAHNIDFEDDNSSELVHDYLFGQDTENAKKAVADAVKEMTEEQAAQVLAFIREMGNAQKAV